MPAAGARGRRQVPVRPRHTRSCKARHWLDAREYFRRLVDTYPQSPYRDDAKLGIGDSYLGEGRHRLADPRRQRVPRVPARSSRSTRAPTTRSTGSASRRCKQMLGPERDQTATDDALARARRRSCRCYPEQHATGRKSTSSTRGPRPAVGQRVPGRAVLLPDPLVPGAIPRLQSAAQRRSASTRDATRCTSTSARSLTRRS